jgi:cell division protein FtsI/penicillin-binding protein 2
MKLVTQEGGTAPKAAVEGYEVAGKTGTAQKWIANPNGRGGYYSHSKYTASFIGFVPADDPAFVLLIVADEPSRGGHYGGTIAAPTFSRIAEKTLRYLQVAPTTTAFVDYAPHDSVPVSDNEIRPTTTAATIP